MKRDSLDEEDIISMPEKVDVIQQESDISKAFDIAECKSESVKDLALPIKHDIRRELDRVEHKVEGVNDLPHKQELTQHDRNDIGKAFDSKETGVNDLSSANDLALTGVYIEHLAQGSDSTTTDNDNAGDSVLDKKCTEGTAGLLNKQDSNNNEDEIESPLLMTETYVELLKERENLDKQEQSGVKQPENKDKVEAIWS